jgi:quinol monooxygenase YgiN
MIVVLVSIRVKAEAVKDFRHATERNARQSRSEPGVARFDVIQQADDPTRFVLIEAYRTTAAVSAHKNSAHYAEWRDTVADMMAEPRVGVKYVNVSPDDEGW